MQTVLVCCVCDFAVLSTELSFTVLIWYIFFAMVGNVLLKNGLLVVNVLLPTVSDACKMLNF